MNVQDSVERNVFGISFLSLIEWLNKMLQAVKALRSWRHPWGASAALVQNQTEIQPTRLRRWMSVRTLVSTHDGDVVTYL